MHTCRNAIKNKVPLILSVRSFGPFVREPAKNNNDELHIRALNSRDVIAGGIIVPLRNHGNSKGKCCLEFI